MSSQVVLARRQGDCAVLCGSRREETTSNAPQMCRNIGDAVVRSHQRPRGVGIVGGWLSDLLRVWCVGAGAA